jgi:outer membrane receptor protein involved in Fe transport
MVKRLRFLLAPLALLIGSTAQAQSITFLHTPPLSAEAGESLHISGNIFGAGNMERARVYYRTPGGRWNHIELREGNSEDFEATIPARDIKSPAIEYYVVAKDLFGTNIDIYASEDRPQRITVIGGNGNGNGNASERTTDENERPPPKHKPEPEHVEPEKHPDAGTSSSRSGNETPDAGGSEVGSEGAVDAGPPEPKSPLEEELALYGAEDVVTLATRHEQSVSDAPAIASSLSQDEMHAYANRIVPDALKMMPGFDTSRDVAGFYHIAVRGLRSDPEVLVLYDGHALNNPYDGIPLLAIPTENLERIEVIRGPGSSLYGTGAFLGVVNLVSSRRDEITATASGGSFTTLEGDATAGHTWGDFGLHADASVVTSKGYQAPITSDVYTADLVTQGLKSASDIAGTTDDHHLFINGGAEARLDIGGGHLSLSARVLREDRGALVGLFDAVGPNSRLQWTAGMADLKFDRPIGAGSISARLFADVQDVDRFYQLSPAIAAFTIGGANAPNGLQEETKFTTQTFGGEVSGVIALHPTNRLELGLSVEELRMPDFSYAVNYQLDAEGDVQKVLPSLQTFSQATGLTGYSAGYQSNPYINTRLQAGLYAQDQWRPVKPLSLTLGVRADVIQLPDVQGQAPNYQINSAHFVPSINPRLGVVVNALPSLSFKALYGHAFRAPTMQELSDTSGQYEYSAGRPTGNPTLLPATVDTVEVGVEQSFTLSEGKVRLRGDGFWNRFSNPILAVDLNGNDVPLLNRNPGLDVKGAEIEARFEASNRAGAFFNYSWFRATDLAALAPQFQYLTDVPQYRINVGLQVPLGPYLNLDVLTQLGAERRNDAFSKLQATHRYEIPSYALVTAQVRTEPLFGHLELALAGYNVTQEDYRDDVPRPDRIPDLLPGPGFAAMFTARTRW